jgi:hypothetical protein
VLSPLSLSLSLSLSPIATTMRRSSHPVTSTTSTLPEEATTLGLVDPGILAFGTSVSVFDDLRRTIQSQVEEIVTDASKITDDCKSENKIGQELGQSRAHAVQEARVIHVGTTENLETLWMNQGIFNRLEDTFQNEILAPRAIRQDDTSTAVDETAASPLDLYVHHRMDLDELKNGTQSMPHTTTPTWSVQGLQKGHRSMETEIKTLTEPLKVVVQLLQEQTAQTMELSEAAHDLRCRVASDNIEDRMMHKTSQNQVAVEELESEYKRHSALLTNHNAASKRAEEMEERLVVLVRFFRRTSLPLVKPEAFGVRTQPNVSFFK